MESTQPETRSRAGRALAGYVHAVAAELGLPDAATISEVSDTADAYVALARRCPAHTNEDLMLVWTPTQGWFVALETSRAPRVIAYLGGTDPLPEPAAVRAFVDEAVARCGHEPIATPHYRTPATESLLADRLARYLR